MNYFKKEWDEEEAENEEGEVASFCCVSAESERFMKEGVERLKICKDLVLRDMRKV